MIGSFCAGATLGKEFAVTPAALLEGAMLQKLEARLDVLQAAEAARGVHKAYGRLFAAFSMEAQEHGGRVPSQARLKAAMAFTRLYQGCGQQKWILQ